MVDTEDKRICPYLRSLTIDGRIMDGFPNENSESRVRPVGFDCSRCGFLVTGGALHSVGDRTIEIVARITGLIMRPYERMRHV
jgi:hypothetical protein